MRILHVHKYYHARDGAGRYLFDLMRLQESAGHTTAVLAMDEARNAPSVWNKYFVSNLDTSGVHGLRASVRQFGRALWSLEAKDRMEDVLTAFRPDVVHAHNLYTHLSPSVLAPCKKRGIPVVMTVHDYGLLSANYTLSADGRALPLHHTGIFSIARSRFIKGSFMATLVLECITRLQRRLKLFDKSIKRYLANSEFVRNTLISFGFSADKIGVVLPCVSPELFGRHFSHDRENAVLFAGRLEAYKGVSTYLEAAALKPEVTFYIAGTGPMVREVEAFAKTHPNVIYLGFVEPEELWKRMANVRAFVAPSLWYEPFGIVAIESLAVGTPILVSAIGGLSEIVKKSGGGLTFTPGNADALAQAMTKLFDHAQYEELVQKGKKYVEREHAPETFVKNVLKEYEAVL